MTEIIAGGSPALPHKVKPSADRASWPYVDRRHTVKTVDIHPSRRASDIRAAASYDLRSQRLLSRLHAPVRWDSLYAGVVVAGDALAALGAGLIASSLTVESPVGPPGSPMHVFAFLLMPLAWTLCVYLQRGYQRRLLGAGAEELRLVAVSAVVFFAAFAVVGFATRSSIDRTYVAVVVPLTTFGSLLCRYLCRRLLHVARRRGRCLTDVLLVGPSSAVVNLARQLQHERLSGLRVVGACVSEAVASDELSELGVPVLGDLHQAAQVVRQTGVGAVAVTACTEMYGAGLRQLAWDLEGTGADLMVAPSLLEITGPRLHLRPIAGFSLLHVDEPEFTGGRRLLKAAIDRVTALLGCLLLAPAFSAIWVTIRLTSKGPAFYRQLRIGLNGEEFIVCKFRSMYVDAEQRLAELQHHNECDDGLLFKIHDDPRVTPIGRWLRRFSLDELPQLLNVVRGEMSLVGPRPPLPSEVARYGSAVQRRLLVKPGVTGLWQVSGRSDLTWEESVRLDLRYVENWSLMLDLSILWKTVFAVVRGSGAY